MKLTEFERRMINWHKEYKLKTGRNPNLQETKTAQRILYDGGLNA